MQQQYCVVILKWDAGRGGSASQFSVLSSISSLSGGEVGHLALAAFVFETNDTETNIDGLIRDALSKVVGEESLMTLPFPIGDTGIISASYLSFWGTTKSFCGGNGEMHTAFNADYAALLRRKPDIIKCAKITHESYDNVTERILAFHRNFGNWRPTRNCSTLVKESLNLAISIENDQPLLRRPTCYESLIDTPDSVSERFPNTIVIEYAQQRPLIGQVAGGI